MTGRATCQAVGCPAAHRPRMFMCKAHWNALPQPLRSQVNATWRAWTGRPLGEGATLWLAYIEATDEAKRWTAQGEGKIAEFEPAAPRIRALQALRAETAK